jgi:hypothetical protein
VGSAEIVPSIAGQWGLARSPGGRRNAQGTRTMLPLRHLDRTRTSDETCHLSSSALRLVPSALHRLPGRRSWVGSRPGLPAPAPGVASRRPAAESENETASIRDDRDAPRQSAGERSEVGHPGPSRMKPHRGGREADARVRSAQGLGSARRGSRVRSSPGRRRAARVGEPPGRTGPHEGERQAHAWVRSAPRLGSARGLGFARRMGPTRRTQPGARTGPRPDDLGGATPAAFR